MIVLPAAENPTIVSSFFWTKHRNVTEGRKDIGRAVKTALWVPCMLCLNADFVLKDIFQICVTFLVVISLYIFVNIFN